MWRIIEKKAVVALHLLFNLLRSKVGADHRLAVSVRVQLLRSVKTFVRNTGPANLNIN